MMQLFSYTAHRQSFAATADPVAATGVFAAAGPSDPTSLPADGVDVGSGGVTGKITRFSNSAHMALARQSIVNAMRLMPSTKVTLDWVAPPE